MLSELVRRICTQDLHSFILQHRRQLEWMDKSLQLLTFPIDGDVISGKTLHAVLLFDTKFKKSPPSVQSLRDHVDRNPDKLTEFAQGATAINDELNQLAEWSEANTDLHAVDLDVLFADTFNKIRAAMHSSWAQTYKMIANGSSDSIKRKDGTILKGANDAMEYLRGRWVRDFTVEVPPLAGTLQENRDAIFYGLRQELSDESTEGKLPLLYDHIDLRATVGKQDLRFIGIVGQSGDGKTTLTDSIVYNWMKQGAHILYISTEHTPLQIMQKLVFMHQGHEDYDHLTKVSRERWRRKVRITQADRENITDILNDLVSRRNIPGLINVQSFRDWDTIVDYLKLTNAKEKWDALVIDYMARLEVGGRNLRETDQLIEGIIHKAQGLTRTFNEGKGLVILTPIQVNREASKAAMKAEVEEWEGHYNINAIRMHTAFINDMDLILSVYSDVEMKDQNEIEIACLKHREGKPFPKRNMYVDQDTGKISYSASDAYKFADEIRQRGETAESMRTWATTTEEFN